MSCHLEDLPNEIFLWICSFLDCEDCHKLKLLCKKFENILVNENRYIPKLITTFDNGFPINLMAFSSDEKKIAVVHKYEEIINIWNLETKECQTFKTHFKPDLNKIIGISFTGYNEVIVVGYDTGIIEIISIKKAIYNAFTIPLSLSKNSRIVSLYFFNEFFVFGDLSIPSKMLEFSRVWLPLFSKPIIYISSSDYHNKIRLATFFNKETIAISISKCDLLIYDLDIGKCNIKLKGHTDIIYDFAIFSDNVKIVSASTDCTLKVWHLEYRECILTLKGHTSGIKIVSVFSNDKKAISSSLDGTMRIWNLETGKCISIIDQYADMINTISIFSNDEKFATSSSDGRLRIWDLNKCDLHK